MAKMESLMSRIGIKFKATNLACFKSFFFDYSKQIKKFEKFYKAI